MVLCRRCSECRKTFRPAPSARKTQRVCEAGCRSKRDRRLAQARRRRELAEARAEERARQQACRERRSKAGCHAAASAPKRSLTQQEVEQFVDRALELSRATLVREVRGILRRLAPIGGSGEGGKTAMSRASLAAQASDTVDVSDENLAELSRVTLGDRAL